MSERNKESSPPPLLLMGATEGLTLTPATGSSLLMPVPQANSPLMPADEGGEEDSFVGQGPPASTAASSTFNYFQPPASTAASDPFAQVGLPPQAPPPAASLNTFPPPAPLPTQFEAPPASVAPPRGESSGESSHEGTPSPPDLDTIQPAVPAPMAIGPPRGAGGNFHRMSGPMRYAQPPAGTYAPTPGQPGQFPLQPGPPAGPPSSMAPPPSSVDVPMMPPSSMDAPAPLPTFQNAPPAGPFGAPPPPSTGAPQGIPMPSEASISPPTFGSPPTSQFAPPGAGSITYTPISHHWFYCKNVELRQMWQPFTMLDSSKLEEAFRSGHQDNVVVSVEGGRYDVDVIERTRSAIYWDEPPSKVKRCSWFYKLDGDTRFVPYEEDFADKLESEYRNAIQNNIWHKKLEFPGGETIVMHNPSVIVHFKSTPDEWGTTQSDGGRPKVVKRGIDETFENVAEGEPNKVDHVIFVVHGIGSTCDLRFRNIVECVDDFRSVALQMLGSHFAAAVADGRVGRVEFLPVRWHAALHGDATGVDRRLKAITLNSIGKLRHFTNDTLLDILFYASPRFAQKIADTVGEEMNRLWQLFQQRNPGFKGQASVAGHSLGSLILFDLLSHQRDPSMPEPPTTVTPPPPAEPVAPTPNIETEELNGEADEIEQEESLESLLDKLGLNDYAEAFQKEKIDMETLALCEDSDIKEMGIPMGPRKKLQGYIKDLKQKQARKEKAVEAQARREAEQKAAEAAAAAAAEAQAESRLQDAAEASNDPLLRSASNTSVNFVSATSGTGIPYVKYPQLDFVPANFFALGSPIAMFLTVRGVEGLGEDFKLPTCQGFFNIFHPFDPVAYRIEPLISQFCPVKAVQIPHHKGRKRLHLELKDSLSRMGSEIKQRMMESVKYTWKVLQDFAAAHKSAPPPEEKLEAEVMDSIVQQMAERDDDNASIASSVQEEEVPIGLLNQGRRLDFVLQESPVESFNDYLFALGSHLCYWESEDTALMLLRETYSLMGISPQRPGLPSPLSPQGLPPVGPPPVGPPPPQRGPGLPLGLPAQAGGPKPLRPVDNSIYGGPVASQTMPNQMAGPPPMAGFVRKS